MRQSRLSDRAFIIITGVLAATVLLVAAAILLGIGSGARLSLGKFGFGFVTSQTWDPVQEVFGALPFIYGTLVTSLIALLLAGLVGVGGAIFLSELAPNWLRQPLSFLVAILVAHSCIVYRIWRR